MSEIARKANVSISTVSLSLSNKGQVAQETRDKVLEIARQLNYERQARRGRKTMVLMIEELPVPVLSDSFLRRLITSMGSAAQEKQYDLLLSVVRNGSFTDSLIGQLDNEKLDGIAIVGGGDLTDEFIELIKGVEVPLVLIDNYVMNESFHCVVPDNLQGGYLATNYLIGLGHRRIGLIQGPIKDKTLTERFLGYVYALRDHQLPFEESLVPSRRSHGDMKGFEEMKQLLSMADPPTAVFAVSDKTAIGALRACQELGVRVPDDVSIIGFDNLPDLERLDVPLTTIETPIEDMGRTAIEKLNTLICGSRDAVPVKTMIGTCIVERNSCRPADR